MLLVAIPGAPSSYLFLVAMPFAPSSVLALHHFAPRGCHFLLGGCAVRDEASNH